jgi:hypothetical protein
MSERAMRMILIAFGLGQLGLGSWQAIDPGSFYDALAGFGERNDHYMRDLATFPLAIGAGVLVSVSRPSWRVPVLAVALMWYAAHAVNHLADIGKGDPDWVGPADFAALALTTALLGYLCFVAARQDVDAAREADADRPEPARSRTPDG